MQTKDITVGMEYAVNIEHSVSRRENERLSERHNAKAKVVAVNATYEREHHGTGRFYDRQAIVKDGVEPVNQGGRSYGTSYLNNAVIVEFTEDAIGYSVVAHKAGDRIAVKPQRISMLWDEFVERTAKMAVAREKAIKQAVKDSERNEELVARVNARVKRLGLVNKLGEPLFEFNSYGTITSSVSFRAGEFEKLLDQLGVEK